MTNAEMLTALKVDLGIKTEVYDDRLTQLLNSAQIEIERTGVTLQDDVADANLVIMWAMWRWRKRQTGEGMPQSLRLALNSRIVHELNGGDA